MAISAARRRSLPSSSFGLPGKKKYPLDTIGRARNALSRAAQNASPSERAQIKRRVKSRYPSIKVGGRK
jgi:hypothetical protein